MNTILIIDDSVERQTEFQKKFLDNPVISAYTSKQAISCINLNNPEVIFLDGDLGDNDCGTHVARFLANHEHDYKIECVIIHSVNIAKAKEMHNLLEFGNIPNIIIPYTVLWKEPHYLTLIKHGIIYNPAI